MRHTFGLLLFLLFAGLLILPASSAIAARAVGVDVSHYDATVTWPSVAAAGKTFAWAKADEGATNTYNDAYFLSNMVNAKSAGVYIGAYHFARPESNTDATAEAAHFLSVVQPNGPNGANNYLGTGYFRPMLDIESAGDSSTAGRTYLSNWINTFCDYVVAHGGGSKVEPVIYMNSNYATNFVNSTVASRDLDVANYGSNAIDPPVPTGNPSTGVFPTWAFWQYGSRGRVPGIGGGVSDVDIDVANGDINFVKQFVISGTPERFDVNGATAGSGVTNGGSYTWEAAGYSSTTDGTDPISWADGSFLRLAAGTDAAASNYPITANSNHTFAGVSLQANGGGTVTINGSGVLSIVSGDQGFYVNAGSQNLYINAVLAGSGQLVWQGSGSGTGNQSGGSLFLLGNNTYSGGTALNAGSGVNFNNDHSFGTGRITWGYSGGTATQFVLADDAATAPVTLANAVTTKAGGQLIYVGPAVAPVTFSGAWTLPSGSSRLTIGNASHTTAKMTISGAIGGSGGALVKDGVGTLILSGASTYDGGTTLNAGALLVMNTGNTSATGTGAVTAIAGTTIGGSGRIGGNLSASGIIAPGNAGAGTLRVGGTYTQSSTGQLNIELASGSSYDALAVTGAASLAGNLSVSAIGGYAPHEGDTFQILTASTLNNTAFNAPSLPTLTGNLIWKVAYAATNLTLSVLLPGDFDGSGTVDAGDYLVWKMSVGQAAGTLLNDTAGGTIGSAQYDLWRSKFGNSAGAGSGASLAQTAVPEPSAIILSLVAAALVAIPRNRRPQVAQR